MSHMPLAWDLYETIPQQTQMLQFNGTNGKEIVQYVREHINPELQTARNGGNWIQLTYKCICPDRGEGDPCDKTDTIRKGDWISLIPGFGREGNEFILGSVVREEHAQHYRLIQI